MLNDEELALRAQGGNIDAFGALVERYEPRLSRYAHRFLMGQEDTEDLVQDSLLKAYENIKDFDTLRRFSPWMYRIAHNVFVNAIRARPKAPLAFFDADTLFPQPVADDAPDREADREITRQLLEKHLAVLDPKYREPLVLFYFEELNYTDIAEVLHLPVATVGVRLKRGRDQLREPLSLLKP